MNNNRYSVKNEVIYENNWLARHNNFFYQYVFIFLVWIEASETPGIWEQLFNESEHRVTDFLLNWLHNLGFMSLLPILFALRIFLLTRSIEKLGKHCSNTFLKKKKVIRLWISFLKNTWIFFFNARTTVDCKKIVKRIVSEELECKKCCYSYILQKLFKSLQISVWKNYLTGHFDRFSSSIVKPIKVKLIFLSTELENSAARFLKIFSFYWNLFLEIVQLESLVRN